MTMTRVKGGGPSGRHENAMSNIQDYVFKSGKPAGAAVPPPASQRTAEAVLPAMSTGKKASPPICILLEW